MPLSTAGITGIDGVVPVHDPYARWQSWNIEEIYMVNGPGAKRYVPKINDYVEDTVAFVTYIVTAIDPVTLMSTLTPINRNVNNGVINTEDTIIGVGPGTQSDTYRVYLDTSVTPHILAVDARLKVGGSMANYVKIFKGSNLTSSGKVVSFLYDPAGTFLTQNIPLELAAIDSHTNHAIKVVSVCYTNEQMADGEIVTVVVYSSDGHVVSRRQLLVENTSFIRSVNSAQKYISHISLRSPFLSTSDQNTLNYPINVPLQAFNMIGVIHYSDNTIDELPVDGSKFKIMGLERFVATVVGQEIQLGLSYALSPGEICYGAVSGDGKFVTEPYRMIVTNQIGSYTVKLFCYPVWVDNNSGYMLKWFMYNLDRDTSFDVTPFVSMNAGTPAFRPTAYGETQKLSARINIRDVSAIFNSYIHIQSVDVVLRSPATARDVDQSNWSIGFEPGQDPQYGLNLKGRLEIISGTLSKITLLSGISTQNEWLEKLYFATKPLYDRRRETRPPEPNFFAVNVNGTRYEFPITAWNNPLSVGGGLEIDDTLFIEFFKRDSGTDMLLGMSAIQLIEA